MTNKEWSDKRMRPLFIGGYPKSGTTLLLSLLDGHPEVLVFPEETRFFGFLLPLLRAGASRQAVLEQAFGQTGVRFFKEGVFDDGAGVRDYSAIDFPRYQDTVESLWASSGYSHAGLLEALVNAYAIVTDQDSTRKRYWVEKSPGNEHCAQDILNLFPEANFIYTLRDPRANYHSYRKKKRKYLKYDMSVEEFLLAWIKSVQSMLLGASLCKAGVNQYLVVLYEHLVSNPRGIMESLSKKIDLSWDERLVSPTRMNLPWEGNSMHGYAFAGVSTEAVEVWKAELELEDRALIESVLGADVLAQMKEKAPQIADTLAARPLGDAGLLFDILTRRRDGLSLRQKLALVARVSQLRSGWLNVRSGISKVMLKNEEADSHEVCHEGSRSR